MSEQVIEQLKSVLSKSSPDFLVDADGNVLHHDMKTGRLHMIEVRAFDVTEVPHTQRPKLAVGGYYTETPGRAVRATGGEDLRMVIVDEADKETVRRMLEMANRPDWRRIMAGSPDDPRVDFPRIFDESAA